ncbi:MAG: RagB/SusD family nutrient uptake outer membrane protein [Balneolaceae bacterium]
MKNFKKILFSYALVTFMIVTSCSLDITNPNQATDNEVLGNAEGIRNLAVGLQGFYAETALPAAIFAPAVTTREMAINTTFASLVELEQGGTVLPPENSRVNRLWNNMMRAIDMAEQLIENAPNVIVDSGELSGIVALSEIHKAMALGYLIQSFQQSPVSTGENAQFFSRDEVLAESISLLQSALNRITTNPPSVNFNQNIIFSGFDIENTIHAYLARHHLLAGNYQDAINASNQVDPSAVSVFTYDGSISRNPVFQGVLSGDEGQEYAPRDNFGTPVTEEGDERIEFYLEPADNFSIPNGLPIDILKGFFSSPSSPIPVYLPGEMNLIRAEAFVNLNQPQNAVNEINIVRTKTSSEDPFGLGANLPEYTGSLDEQSLFTEIYRQRTAELYLTGLRFDDMRRLGRPAPSGTNPPLEAERNRIWYPYTTQERQNNTNTPPNPDI